jgi:hypothetical protein
MHVATSNLKRDLINLSAIYFNNNNKSKKSWQKSFLTDKINYLPLLQKQTVRREVDLVAWMMS